MTEEEILAAPEDDYMSPRQLAFFRLRLQDEQSQLLNNAQQTTSHLQDNESTPDPSDRASVEEEHTLELRVRDRERKLLKKVEDAIARIDAGDYGWCEETGEPIGIARLLARPTATLSLEAQERREKLKKMHGN
ncbi:RNA polymerase-binding transcription factor DksA [Betaproteobacteria bacterium]|nr:RNA polymerase-binding transcription factor DksA [Betaproteobacteria bacterium]GHU12409.1 RNA polymerase-binding transcription factor DksA [Betaproteobacteria bacterium]